MTPPNQSPEEIARDQIDIHLAEADWIVQNKKAIDFSAGAGIAIREYQTDIGRADYALFVAKKAAALPRKLTQHIVCEQTYHEIHGSFRDLRQCCVTRRSYSINGEFRESKTICEAQLLLARINILVVAERGSLAI